MANEIIYPAVKEIQEMRRLHSLSIEELLNLAWQVKDWTAIRVFQHTKKEYSDFEPSVAEFQGRLEGITLNLEADSKYRGYNSGYRMYSIIATTPLNLLGAYKEKESKCVPGLLQIYSSLESKYIQEYFERVKSDMKHGLEEARRLIKNK